MMSALHGLKVIDDVLEEFGMTTAAIADQLRSGRDLAMRDDAPTE